MSSKVENLFNLTNYRDHPENKDFRVVFFYNLEQAKHFESLLNEENIAFESFLEKDAKKELMLYGIHKRDFRRASVLNDASFARYKKKFISNTWIRNSILIITIALVLFAVVGYFMSNT